MQQEGLALRRVIHISSLAHACGIVPGYGGSAGDASGSNMSLGTNFHGLTYCDTKLMNNLVSNYMSRVLNVKSAVVHPGLVHTSILRNQPEAFGLLLRVGTLVYSPGTDGTEVSDVENADTQSSDTLLQFLRRVVRLFYLSAEESANTLLFGIFNAD